LTHHAGDLPVTRILLIEDDRQIAEPLLRALKGAGYEVLHAASGPEGVTLALNGSPDLIILDIMLPGMDGWEVCKRVRESSLVPILMLTALSEELDRVLGLELGADDYLTKPFSTRELLARVKAALRRVDFDRSLITDNRRVTVGGITLDLDQRSVTKDGVALSLRFKEFELLSLLISHAGDVVTRAEIFDKVWGTDWLGDMRTLDVHIRWLREKLEANPSQPQYIQTVRGIGYRFQGPGA
jgi:DNA-binding response OmpR family regulator